MVSPFRRKSITPEFSAARKTSSSVASDYLS